MPFSYKALLIRLGKGAPWPNHLWKGWPYECVDADISERVVPFEKDFLKNLFRTQAWPEGFDESSSTQRV